MSQQLLREMIDALIVERAADVQHQQTVAEIHSLVVNALQKLSFERYLNIVNLIVFNRPPEGAVSALSFKDLGVEIPGMESLMLGCFVTTEKDSGGFFTFMDDIPYVVLTADEKRYDNFNLVSLKTEPDSTKFNSLLNKKSFFAIVKAYRQTFVHEMTHAFNYLVDKNALRRQTAALDKPQKDAMKQNFMTGHETNAYFFDAVDRLLNTSDLPANAPPKAIWAEFLDNLQPTFLELFSEKELLQKFLARLLDIWHENKKPNTSQAAGFKIGVND